MSTFDRCSKMQRTCSRFVLQIGAPDHQRACDPHQQPNSAPDPPRTHANTPGLTRRFDVVGHKGQRGQASYFARFAILVVVLPREGFWWGSERDGQHTDEFAHEPIFHAGVFALRCGTGRCAERGVSDLCVAYATVSRESERGERTRVRNTRTHSTKSKSN